MKLVKSVPLVSEIKVPPVCENKVPSVVCESSFTGFGKQCSPGLSKKVPPVWNSQTRNSQTELETGGTHKPVELETGGTRNRWNPQTGGTRNRWNSISQTGETLVSETGGVIGVPPVFDGFL